MGLLARDENVVCMVAIVAIVLAVIVIKIGTWKIMDLNPKSYEVVSSSPISFFRSCAEVMCCWAVDALDDVEEDADNIVADVEWRSDWK